MAGTELLTFFIILMAGLFFSEVFKRLHLPYVTALIVGGIVVGPSMLGLVKINPTIEFIGSIGLVFIMFIAGTEVKTTSLRELKEEVPIFAVYNGVIPLMIGFSIAHLILGYDFIISLILGTIFMSSSIGVIIPSLEAINLTKTTLGKMIITSTVAEDIGSLLLISLILQKFNSQTIIPIYLYIPLIILLIIVLRAIIPRLEKSYHKGKRGKDLFESELRFLFVVLIAAIILFELLGVHAIIAGFITGMILSGSLSMKIFAKIKTLSYGLFIPVFFLSIGAQMDLSVFSTKAAMFTISIIVLGLILSKLLSGWVAGRINKFSSKASWVCGVSTLPQLSTSLAVAFASLKLDLLDKNLFSAIIVLTIITTLITPILIKLTYKRCSKKDLVQQIEKKN